jgi:hypothetical protein
MMREFVAQTRILCESAVCRLEACTTMLPRLFWLWCGPLACTEDLETPDRPVSPRLLQLLTSELRLFQAVMICEHHCRYSAGIRAR